MSFPLLTLALLLSPHGTPDKFWLVQGNTNAEGSRPAVVEGVLLGEDATSYHIRVEGGEITLPKAQVAKVEKDALTVEAIEQSEKAKAEARAEAAAKAAAEREAAEKQAATESAAVPADATAQNPVEAKPEAPAAEPAVEEQPARFDPVRGRFTPGSSPSRHAQLRSLEASYEASGDRAQLKELRRARRAK